jgi:hypothetical protein
MPTPLTKIGVSQLMKPSHDYVAKDMREGPLLPEDYPCPNAVWYISQAYENV